MGECERVTPWFCELKPLNRGLVLLGGVGTPQIVQVANPSSDLEKIKSGVAIL